MRQAPGLAAEPQATGPRPRGRIKVFFGAAPGVGKTYTMLEAAHGQQHQGRGVLVGWIETHGRAETARLLQGLDVLSPKVVEVGGGLEREMDLDGALERRPDLLLVDELAHTNAGGSRHARRWQDVVEIVESGIDVFTTLNVQHVESLNDVVAQITGVTVRETIPDTFLRQVDELELVDLPPDDLLRRLREGKVYVPAEARHAIDRFFRKGNLIALRELALRQTAESVDSDLQGWRRRHGVADIWPARERILVCVSPSQHSGKLLRAASRMAHGLKADLVAAYVETPRAQEMPQEDRDRVNQHLVLAERLGARATVLQGHSISAEVLAFARSHNVTRIVVGKPTRPGWRRGLRQRVADDIVRASAEIDVHMIGGRRLKVVTKPLRAARPGRFGRYLVAVAAVAICTAIVVLPLPYVEHENAIMLYLLGVVIVAARAGREPAMLATVLSVAAFNFFFMPPYYEFGYMGARYALTFAVMLLVGLVVATLTARLKAQAVGARERERRTAALYELARDLAQAGDPETLARVVALHIGEVFGSESLVLVPDGDGRLQSIAPDSAAFPLVGYDARAAQWAFDHRKPAGQGTETLPTAAGLFLPLAAARGSVGVLGIRLVSRDQLEAPGPKQLLEAFANQTALALDRLVLAEGALHTQRRIDEERLRNVLLSSVSHDLRTPLASITGAAGVLLDDWRRLDDATREELILSIKQDSDGLHRQIRNLLDLTRIESGALEVRREWHSLEEVIGVALNRVEGQLDGRPVTTELPGDLPLVPIDASLIERLVVNLLENVIRHTPAGGPIELRAAHGPDVVLLEVLDRGPGIPPAERERVFEKFYRVKRADTGAGTGLGLAICRAAAQAHGGRIWVEDRPGGGSVFLVELPLTEPHAPALSAPAEVAPSDPVP